MNCIIMTLMTCFYSFNGGNVRTAMQTLMWQTPSYARPQIIYDSIYAERTAHACRGTMTFPEALTCVLQGTGITWVSVNDRTYTLVQGVEQLFDQHNMPIINLPVADWRT